MGCVTKDMQGREPVEAIFPTAYVIGTVEVAQHMKPHNKTLWVLSLQDRQLDVQPLLQGRPWFPAMRQMHLVAVTVMPLLA